MKIKFCFLSFLLLTLMTSISTALISPKGYNPPENKEVYGQANQEIELNTGPGTVRFFKRIGTYDVEGEWIRILAKCWDPNNGIYWVKCVIPRGGGIIGWTGLKRFDKHSLNIDKVPYEEWYPQYPDGIFNYE